MSAGSTPTEVEIQARVGAVPTGAAAPSPEDVQRLLQWLRWNGREIRGGMDNYIRVRAAARADALRRVADELQRAAPEGSTALLALAARLRARSLGAEVPTDIALPTLWRPDRPVPELEPGRVRREQQIGFGLGLAQGAAQIHLAAGGQV